jgi:transposase
MAVQALRELTRTRKQLTREKAAHVQRIDRLLQAANLKLGSVLSDIMGPSGRTVLDALARGESDAQTLAALIGPRVRASRAQLVEALRGRFAPHQQLLLRLHLSQADAIDQAIAQIDQEVADRLEPFREAVARLTHMPGVSGVAASVILAEIGFDMRRFPTPAHLVSWAGLCPKNDESAGKRRSTRLRHGAPWLKTLLVQSAWGAVRHCVARVGIAGALAPTPSGVKRCGRNSGVPAPACGSGPGPPRPSQSPDAHPYASAARPRSRA